MPLTEPYVRVTHTAPWIDRSDPSTSWADTGGSRVASVTPAPEPVVFLFLALCGRRLRRPDASGGSVVPPPKGLSANTRPNCRGPVFLNPSLPSLHRLSQVSLLIWRDPTSPWASSGCRCLLPVYRSRGPTWISLSKNTECPVTPAPLTAPASVGFWASRSQTRSPGRSGLLRGSLSFGATVRLELLPHTASRRQGLASHDGSPACSCLWLAVATNSPREGLSPPIQCPCQAHPRLSQNRTCGPRIRLLGSIDQNPSTSWADTGGE